MSNNKLSGKDRKDLLEELRDKAKDATTVEELKTLHTQVGEIIDPIGGRIKELKSIVAEANTELSELNGFSYLRDPRQLIVEKLGLIAVGDKIDKEYYGKFPEEEEL